jgi:hypothetical protein
MSDRLATEIIRMVNNTSDVTLRLGVLASATTVTIHNSTVVTVSKWVNKPAVGGGVVVLFFKGTVIGLGLDP